MPYTTPVTDRTYVDVASGTAKGYFNVGDWVRIYNNTLYINQLVPAVLGLAAPAFTSIATPSTGSFPTVTTFNTLLEGIDNVRLVIEGVGVTITGLDEIYHSSGSRAVQARP